MWERCRHKTETPEESHDDGKGAGAHDVQEETKKVSPLF